MPTSYSVGTHTIQFLIPDRDKQANQVDPLDVEKQLSIDIADAFGGLRKRVEESIWVDPQSMLIHERTIILESSFDDSKLPDLLGLVATFTLLLAGALHQAELAVKIDGNLVLIPTDQGLECNGAPRPDGGKGAVRHGSDTPKTGNAPPQKPPHAALALEHVLDTVNTEDEH